MSKFCRAHFASWTRRLAATVAATVAATGVGVLPAHAADAESAVILNAWVSHPFIDVVDGPVQVTVRLEVQDLGSGIAPGDPWLDPMSLTGSDPIAGQSMGLVSGDRFRGTYETTFTFPEHIRDGEWSFRPRIYDVAGNDYDPPSGDYDNIGIYPKVAAAPDIVAPTVTSAFLNKKFIDVTDGPARVVLTVAAYDAGIGFGTEASGGQQVKNGIQTLYTSRRISSLSPDLRTVTQEVTFEYPKFIAGSSDPRGSYFYIYSGIADRNGNVTKAFGVGTAVVGTRPLRAKLPALSASIGRVTASWAAHSDLLGILEYETEFTGAGIVRNVRTTTTEASIGDLPDGTYTARVRARNQLGWGEWTNASAPVAYIPAPLNGSTPSVSGTVKVGQILTANPGAWTTGTSFAYQWLAGGLAVSGATGSTLSLGPGQAGKAIAVLVTGSKSGYVTSSKTSEATKAVAKGSLVGVIPTITGTARVGSTLTANPGSWSPAPVTLSYQWYRSGVVITGATLSTYKLTSADLGKTSTVRTAARKVGYYVTYKTSAATTSVATNVLTVPRPVIPAAAAVGQTLTVKVGAWIPTVYLRTYQWKRNGVSIPGATASSYKVVAADLGSGLSIAVTGRKSGYLTKTVFSYRTSPVTR